MCLFLCGCCKKKKTIREEESSVDSQLKIANSNLNCKQRSSIPSILSNNQALLHTFNNINNILTIIATIVASPIPESSTEPKGIVILLRPDINVKDAKIKFLDLEKSTFSSINVLSPDTAIVPNNNKLIPPTTGVGIVLIRADIFPEKPKITDIMPAPQITYTL